MKENFVIIPHNTGTWPGVDPHGDEGNLESTGLHPATLGGVSALSRVMQLANDTYKTVWTLWSSSRPERKAPKDRAEIPKFDLDGNRATHRNRKRKAKDVLVLARKAARKSNKAVKALEADFCANSSRACKPSTRQTLQKILAEAGIDPANPPTVDAIKTVACVLKQANYR